MILFKHYYSKSMKHTSENDVGICVLLMSGQTVWKRTASLGRKYNDIRLPSIDFFAVVVVASERTREIYCLVGALFIRFLR